MTKDSLNRYISSNVGRPPVEDTTRFPCTRRSALCTVGLLTVVSTSGCTDLDIFSGDEDTSPVEVSNSEDCEECGMIVEDHPGPIGQGYYENNGEEEPKHFCSGYCLYEYTFKQENEGNDSISLFLTDYSEVDYSVNNNNELSAHTDVGHLVDADELHIVFDTDVEGAMGSAFIPFSDESDATDFAETHDGMVSEHDKITPEIVDSHGM